ncbi:DUF2207 domain-containing protein [Allonocardiopsis opalescens]|uniref:DUF2207 domain-containing protein n=1 Tax=Allonocardiopsis opalescens TaxID=1144618 RepID=A0A2T0Q3R5_9ACTN|nr:DUF2207 domain-containing protein [Allonocardiopsis opalescens]PRX98450.1 hypothetical protein CLV72_10427 [Allonocardiopsis opalescens]
MNRSLRTTAPAAVLIGVAIAALLFFGFRAVQSTDDVIRSYEVEVVGDGGALTVIETITYDYGAIPGWGPVRTLPRALDQPGGESGDTGLRVLGTSSRESGPAEVVEHDDSVEVRFGPSTPLLTGEHTFELRYRYGRAATEGRFVFNAVGQPWIAPVERVRVDYEGLMLAAVGCGRDPATVGPRGVGATDVAPARSGCAMSVERDSGRLQSSRLEPGEVFVVEMSAPPSHYGGHPGTLPEAADGSLASFTGLLWSMMSPMVAVAAILAVAYAVFAEDGPLSRLLLGRRRRTALKEVYMFDRPAGGPPAGDAPESAAVPGTGGGRNRAEPYGADAGGAAGSGNGAADGSA